MAWDTGRTRQKLRDAALAEFAELGPTGASMTQIAQRAGVNKERLYAYFGSKEALWAQVLTEELDRLAGSVPMAASSPGEFAAMAGELFDYHRAHPELARLLQWEGLTLDAARPAPARATAYRAKVRQLRAAQQDGLIDSSVDAGHLLFAVIALAAWWQTVPQMAHLIAGPATRAEQDRRRAFVIEAARRLASPPDGG